MKKRIMTIISAICIFAFTIFLPNTDGACGASIPQLYDDKEYTAVLPVAPTHESLENSINGVSSDETLLLIPSKLTVERPIRITKSVSFDAFDADKKSEIIFERAFDKNNDGQENYRHFIVDGTDITIVFNNLVFSANGFGGGITDDAPSSSEEKARVIFNNCTFTNCQANEGGAILAYETINYEFNDCTFTNNKAVRGGAVAVRGGGEPIFKDCTFMNNKADEYGSAIAVINNLLSFEREVKIIDCDFSFNVTNSVQNSYAGTLAFIEYNREIAIGSKYSKSNGKALVDGCNFQNNFAYANRIYPQGSAICAINMEITVKNSSFIGNVNQGYGTIGVSFPTAEPKFNVENLTIKDNYVGRKGGSLYISSATDFVFTPINTVFGKNYSINGGEIALAGKLPNGNNCVEIEWVGESDMLQGYLTSELKNPNASTLWIVISTVVTVILGAVAVLLLYKFNRPQSHDKSVGEQSGKELK